MPVTSRPSVNFLVVSLLTIVVAFCSIVYELVYSQALTVLYGETVSRYSVTIGLYLLSLGAGAFFYNAVFRRASFRFFWWNELLLSLIGPLGVIAIFQLSTAAVTGGVHAWRTAALVMSHVPVVLVGVLSGFELPLLVGLLDEREKDRFSKVLGLDYVGSFIGTVVYALLLYPQAGLISTAFIVGALNMLALVVYSFWKFGRDWPAKLVAVLFLLLYVALLWFSDDIQGGVQQRYREAEIQKIFSVKAGPAGLASIEVHEHFTTAYQEATLYRVNYANGHSEECLSLDSNLQLCDSWIGPYHEGLVDVPVSFLPARPLRVLVLGGGDWIGINRLLRLPNVERIDHVDIDGEFLTFMKDHPHYRAYQGRAWRDSRVHTVVDDAFNYARFNAFRYDLVVFDLPGITHDKLSHLYSVEFFGFLARALKEDGILVMWDYNPSQFRRHYRALMASLKAAGFQWHVLYDANELLSTRWLGSQSFYLLSKSRGEDQAGHPWTLVPDFPDVRPNTVLRPNYDVVLHYG